tara:strand:+ start:3744 stop:4607 length:864 start_codon:yes stop_codon:yes gene_type:complete
MAFNKIQPEQCQPRITHSPSGDIKIYSTDTGLSVDLSRGLTGDFNFSGSLTLNERPVFPLANTASNTYDANSGSFVLNGVANDVRAEQALVVNSSAVTMSGFQNIALNGTNQTFESGTLGCMSIGNVVTFPEVTTGAVILTDSKTASTTALGNDYLDINFEGGTYIQGGNMTISTDLTIDSSYSGMFSGNLGILGEAYLTGYNMATIHDITGLLSGENFVNVGAEGSRQSIVGEKEFDTGIRFTLPFARDIFSDVSVHSGQLAMSGDQLLFKTENGHWTGVALTGIN